MASIAASWRIIEGVLWQNAHSVHRALRKPATDAQIARLAKLVPAKLPGDFVQSLRIHNGLRNSYHGLIQLFDNNALLPVSAIITEYRMQCEQQSKYGTGGSPEVGDPAVRNDAYWRPGWVPILDAGGAGGLVLDLDPASGGAVGQVFKWSFGGSPAPEVLARSFGEWLAVLAEMLVKRQFGLDEFGGIWLGGVPSATANAAPDQRGTQPFRGS